MRGRVPEDHDEGEDLFRTSLGSSTDAVAALAERLREAGGAAGGPGEHPEAGEAHRDAPVLLDVRAPEAFQRTRVRGARSCPADELEERVDDLPGDRWLYVYGEDAGDATAARVTLQLARAGHRVQEVQGGLRALEAAGAPVAGSDVEG